MNREQRRKMGKGFRKERRTVSLTFDENHDLHGLEIEIKTVSMETFLDLLDLLAEADNLEDVKEVAPAMRRLYEALANALVDWNLETESGEPVPATLDGLRMDVLDTNDVQLLIGDWLSAIGGVYGPLGQTSAGGENLADLASIHTETLQGSQAS